MIAKGDRLMAFGDRPLRQRLYIEVTRVAKDRTWADIRVCNCYVMWTKRQKLDHRGLPPLSEPYDWDERDLSDQDHQWDPPPSDDPLDEPDTFVFPFDGGKP